MGNQRRLQDPGAGVSRKTKSCPGGIDFIEQELMKFEHRLSATNAEALMELSAADKAQLRRMRELHQLTAIVAKSPTDPDRRELLGDEAPRPDSRLRLAFRDIAVACGTVVKFRARHATLRMHSSQRGRSHEN